MRYLITGDIHIDDYKSYNPYPKSRFEQFRTLAELLIDSAKVNNCTDLIIAGDIINKPTNPPYVNHMVDEFFIKLTSHFNNVYYILGQHDLSTKSVTQEFNDSDINRLDNYITNLHYMNKKFIVDDSGHTIYFQNWTKTQDLSHLESKVDLFIGHITIGNKLFSGQELILDRTKFDLCVSGDIHNHKVTDNVVSIGSPIQVSITDSTLSPAVVYDTTDRSWQLIELDPDDKLPRMYYTPDKELSGPRIETNEYYVYRPSVNKTGSKATNLELADEWNSNEELINSTIIKNNLQHIHAEIKGSLDYKPINFNFKLLGIEIVNIRSIRYLNYEFNPGNTIITGLNGSGKSTLLKCIDWGMRGNNKLKDSITRGEKTGSITESIWYDNKIFKIVRTTHHGDQFFIDGVEVNTNTKRDLNVVIHEYLPFLHYSNSFFIQSYIKEILGSFNSSTRIDLLAKHYRLDSVSEHGNAGQVKLDKLNVDVKNLQKTIIDTNLLIENIELLITQLDSTKLLDEEMMKNLLINIDFYKALNDKKDKYVKLSNNSTSTYEKLTNMYNELVLKNTEILELDAKIAKVNNETNLSTKSTLDKEKLGYSTELSNYDTKKTELTNLTTKIAEFNAGLELLKQNKCVTCSGDINVAFVASQTTMINEVLDTSNKTHAEITEYINKTSKESIELKITAVDEKLKVVNDAIQDYNSDVKLSTSLRASYSTMNTNYTKLTAEYNLIVEELNKFTIENEASMKYILELTASQISEELLRLNDIKSVNDTFTNYNTTIDNYHKVIQNTNDSIDLLKPSIEDYTKYVELFKMDGIIYSEILTNLTSKFTNELFKFQTQSIRKNGNPFSDLSVLLNVRGEWIPYVDLSDGQKVLCDLYFMYRVMVVKGVIIFDEFFRSVDDYSLETITDYLSMFDANNLLICTHSDNFTLESTKLIFELDENGTTKIIH